MPPRFEGWLKQVISLNMKIDPSILTEANIKRAWTDTLRDLSLDSRVEEMNSKASRSVMLDLMSKLQYRENFRISNIANSGTRWHAHIPGVPKELDVSEYKIPSLRPKHLEAVRYSHFAKQVQQGNIGKPFNREVVDACFWQMVDALLKKVGIKSRVAAIMKEAKSVMAQADAHWRNV